MTGLDCSWISLDWTVVPLLGFNLMLILVILVAMGADGITKVFALDASSPLSRLDTFKRGQLWSCGCWYALYTWIGVSLIVDGSESGLLSESGLIDLNNGRDEVTGTHTCALGDGSLYMDCACVL